MNERVLSERILHGLEFVPLPDGWVPQQACLLVKCTDSEGDPVWAIRTSDDMVDEELLGVLIVRVDMLRASLVEAYIDPEG